LEGGDRFPRRNFLRFNCFKLFLKKDKNTKYCE
jgi:hypothetical protein